MLDWLAKFVHENPFLGVFLISLVISLFFSVIMKFFTNQERMKEIKEKQKELQKKMKDHKDDKKKVLEIQQEMMKYTGEMMRHSFKPMLITFIPLILVLSWGNASIAYQPIKPGEEFIITAFLDKYISGNISIEVPNGINLVDEIEKKAEKEVKWILKGEEGDYFIKFLYNNKIITKKVIITGGFKYASLKESYKEGDIKTVKIGNKKLVVIPIFGGIGWLGSYIIFSLVLNIFVFKKLFKLA